MRPSGRVLCHPGGWKMITRAQASRTMFRIRGAAAVCVTILVGASLSACVGGGAASPPSRSASPRSSETPGSHPTTSAPPSPATPAASGGGTEQAGRAIAVQACEAVRDTISQSRDQAIAGQNRGLELATQAATAAGAWTQLRDHMAALANAPFPKLDEENADWGPHLDAYFALADQDCTPLGVILPQGG